MMTSKQENLFALDEQKRKRKVDTFVKSKSKDGSLSVTIVPDVARRVRNYCKLKNLNCTKLICDIVAEKISELEAAKYDDMSRDDLLDLIHRMEAEREADA